MCMEIEEAIRGAQLKGVATIEIKGEDELKKLVSIFQKMEDEYAKARMRGGYKIALECLEFGVAIGDYEYLIRKEKGRKACSAKGKNGNRTIVTRTADIVTIAAILRG